MVGTVVTENVEDIANKENKGLKEVFLISFKHLHTAASKLEPLNSPVILVNEFQLSPCDLSQNKSLQKVVRIFFALCTLPL